MRIRYSGQLTAAALLTVTLLGGPTQPAYIHTADDTPTPTPTQPTYPATEQPTYPASPTPTYPMYATSETTYPTPTPAPLAPTPEPPALIPLPTVSVEPQKLIQVPDLPGLGVYRARDVLAVTGLSVGQVIEQHTDSDVPAGTVLGSRPGSGTAVPTGSAVDLIVALPRR